MKAQAIAAIILILILPFGLFYLPEVHPDSHGVAMDSDGLLWAANNTDGFIQHQPQNSAMRWFKRKNGSPVKGVALVVHGLNSRPDKMESIIAAMTAAGIDCLNLSLRGHGENYSHTGTAGSAEARMASFKSVSYRLWRSEIYRAYQQVKISANRYGTCVFLVGFSMGGLLGVDLLTSNPYIRFDKMVLFAPALKMHSRNYLLKLLSPFSGLVVPSPAPDAYLANKGTPIAAYNAFFEVFEHFEKNLDPKINVPTVIFIDQQDELISFSKLNAMIQNHKLDRWKLHPVKKDPAATEIKMHHIIIDEASVGKQMWKEMVATTITHLLDGAAACVPAR